MLTSYREYAELKELIDFKLLLDLGHLKVSALSLGAEWAGGSDEAAPEPLDAAIIYAPVGALVPTALKAVRPGGTVVLMILLTGLTLPRLKH